jgi:hypothetical protein
MDSAGAEDTGTSGVAGADDPAGEASGVEDPSGAGAEDDAPAPCPLSSVSSGQVAREEWASGTCARECWMQTQPAPDPRKIPAAATQALQADPYENQRWSLPKTEGAATA